MLRITTLENGSRVVMRGGDEDSRVVRKDTFIKQNNARPLIRLLLNRPRALLLKMKFFGSYLIRSLLNCLLAPELAPARDVT